MGAGICPLLHLCSHLLLSTGSSEKEGIGSLERITRMTLIWGKSSGFPPANTCRIRATTESEAVWCLLGQGEFGLPNVPCCGPSPLIFPEATMKPGLPSHPSFSDAPTELCVALVHFVPSFCLSDSNRAICVPWSPAQLKLIDRASLHSAQLPHLLRLPLPLSMSSSNLGCDLICSHLSYGPESGCWQCWGQNSVPGSRLCSGLTAVGTQGVPFGSQLTLNFFSRKP